MIQALILFMIFFVVATASSPTWAQTSPAPETTIQTPVPSSDKGIQPLIRAKTIRVVATSYKLDWSHGNRLVPDAKMTVVFSRPGSYRISAKPLGADGLPLAKPDIFVTDGSTVNEYIGENRQYLTRTVSNSPRFRLSELLKLDARGAFKLLADGGVHAFEEWKKDDYRATVTQTQAQLNGKAVRVVFQDVWLAPTLRYTIPKIRIWISSKTGLPLRYQESCLLDGKEVVLNRVDYSNWVLDKPVSPATFTWTGPAKTSVYETKELLAVGATAPDFSVITPGGKRVHLSDFKGKLVVLDFWATWCVPCQAALPHLESVYRRVKDQNVVILGLCVWDTQAAYRNWVAAKKGTYTFPTAFDPLGYSPSNIAQSKYAVNAIPVQYVIDKDGRVAAAYTSSKDDTQLENALVKLGVILPVKDKASHETSHKTQQE